MNPIPEEETGSEKDGLRTFKLILEYDGSDFAGWQVQPGKRTVQGEIEKCLAPICKGEVRVTGAGRTDSGVHALGQVASFRTAAPHSAEILRRALNATLPCDVRVLAAEEAEFGFDARKSALCRMYRYVIAKRRLAVGRQYAWSPQFRFRLAPMVKASECLTGEHRWSAFCRRDPEEREYRSRVFWVRWHDDADRVVMEIKAERFFHNMVRILAGSLVDVGRGRTSLVEFRRALESGARADAGPTAPPHGLFLVRVEYD